MRRDVSTSGQRPLHRVAAALAAGACGLAACTGTAAAAEGGTNGDGAGVPLAEARIAVPIRAERMRPLVELGLSAQVNDALGLGASGLLQLDRAVPRGRSLELELRVGGEDLLLEIWPHSVRAANYNLRAQLADGSIVEQAPGPIRTVRGQVVGEADALASGAVLEDGLHLMFRHAGERWFIEPVPAQVGGPENAVVLYRGCDVLPHGGTCGMSDAAMIDQVGDFVKDGAAADVQGAEICVAELACDADVQYFNDYGSVAAVESRINTIINTVNQQYENEVGIRHEITDILVRTAEPDPYTSSDASTLLCQFITEWTNNQQGVQRDVAHLFTGRSISGGTIGIAADIGQTGICVTQGSCSGGQFGTQGSYCLAESDFNNNFSCATDLTAHELGHLWGAFHCSCPNNTMNPFITCTNDFSNQSINSITSYRDSRTCLDCTGAPPPNDDCVTAAVVSANSTTIVDTTEATPAPGGSDPQLPAGSPSCQWDGMPSDTHSTVWYRFTAVDTSIAIETCDTTDVADTIIALYDGNCGNLVELACGEDECGGGDGFRSRICFDGLDPGQSYLVMVGNPGGYAGSQPGIVELELISPCPEIGPQAGSCCFIDGDCQSGLIESECLAAGGTFNGVGSTCSTPCPEPTGACCLPNFTCQVRTVDECALAGGTFQGVDVSCNDVSCLPASACCLPDGSCLQVDPLECQALGGEGQPFGSECVDVDCPQPADCPTDLDGSGDTGFNDLLQLLSGWGACPGGGDPCPADFDGTGEVGFNDLLTLLSAYGPCP